jgi:sugar phosphate isomerase/epimerase
VILAISGQALSRRRPFDEVCALFNRLDVRWIELWPPNVEGGDSNLAVPEARYEGRDLGKARDILNAHGIGVACVTLDGAFTAAMVAEPKDYLAALRKATDVAVELGARLVNSYCYHFALGRDADIKPLVAVLRPAAAYAKDRGITLVLENEAHDASATVDGMLRILDAVESDAMKTNFDPANYYQATEEPFPYAYDRLKHYIAYVHLKNGCIYNPAVHAEAGRRGSLTGWNAEQHMYYPPYPFGAINIEALIERLQRDRYKGFCTLEPHVPPHRLEEYYQVETAHARRSGIE